MRCPESNIIAVSARAPRRARVFAAATAMLALTVSRPSNTLAGIAPDFKVQRGETLLYNTTATLTAGVDYTAPASASNAFIRLVNTRLSGAGKDSGGGTQGPSSWMTLIDNPGNITNSITFARYNGGDSSMLTWEIIEYIGAPGGPNEIIVRDAAKANASGGNNATGAVVTDVAKDGDVVVFITGQRHNATQLGRTDRGLFVADWLPASNYPSFSRTDKNGASSVSYAVVEFTGANWNVQRIQQQLNTTTDSIIKAITPVSTDRAFIHGQVRSNHGGVDEHGVNITFDAPDAVRFERHPVAAQTQVAAAWIVENTETEPVLAMNVSHYTGTRASGGAVPESWTNTIAPVADTARASIMGEGATDSVSANTPPRGSVNLRLTATNQVAFWQSDSNNDRAYVYSVIEWPSSVYIPPGGPAINNLDVADVGGSSATLQGELTSTGNSATAVWVFYGTNDGGEVTGNWDTNVYFGNGLTTGPYSTNVTGLSQGTTYFYRFAAANAVTSTWALTSERFKTLSAPAVDNVRATDIAPTSAALNGALTDGGQAHVYIFWGTTDGQDTPSAWANTNYLGELQEGAFSATVSNLAQKTLHYYRCYVSNAVDTAWAAPSAEFTSGILFVDTNATAGLNNGGTWANAFLQLSSALGNAAAGSEIWVAAGTHSPGASASDTFTIDVGVTLYGGFTSGDAWQDRDPMANVTVLDGGAVNYHVVSKVGAGSAALDGFTIANGAALAAGTDEDGGGVYCAGGSLSLLNCVFTNNICHFHGGAVFCAAAASVPVVSNCTFIANRSTNSAGGALYLDNGATEFTDTLFITNTSWGGGGVMWINSLGNPDVSFINCHFTNNASVRGEGGVMYLRHNNGELFGELLISNCTFTGNTALRADAARDAGAIFFGDGTVLTIANTVFTDNRCSDRGGAILSAAGPNGAALELFNCEFYGNRSQNVGGAVSLDNDGAMHRIHDCTFSGNASLAAAGGAYRLAKAAGGTDLEVFNSTFTSNSASAGGAIRMDDLGAVSPVISNCTFIGNSTFNGSGGGIYSGDGDTLTIVDCEFTANTTLVTGGDHGSAVFQTGAVGGKRVDIRNCSFTANRSNGRAALYLNVDAGEGIGVVSNCTFAGNEATNNHAGALYLNDGDVHVFDCAFTSNSAALNGGAVWLDMVDGPTPTFVGCTFTANRSQNPADNSGGGAIFGEGNGQLSLVVSNSVFRDNASESEGGAIRLGSGSTLTLAECDFFDNTSNTREGGAVRIGAMDSAMENCLFARNACGTLGLGGGALQLNGNAKVFNITNCTFHANMSGTAGGAIQFDVGTLNLGNSIFTANTATSGGNDIHVDLEETMNISYCGIDRAGIWAEGTVNYGAGIYNLDPRFVDPGADDFHLQSTTANGVYVNALGAWTNLPHLSPYIDRGDPASSYINEPAPDGGRVNMGRYGNTAFASRRDPGPWIAALGAVPRPNYAELPGEVFSTNGGQVAVFTYWGTTDHADNRAAWIAQGGIIANGTLGEEAFTADTPATLVYGQQYYYRCYATNALGEAWSETEAFSPARPAGNMLTNMPPADLTASSATLKGQLSASDSIYDVWLHWGTSDGGTSTSAWDETVYVGAVSNVASFNLDHAVTGLAWGTTYYYSFRATNDVEDLWGTPAIAFQPLGPPLVNNDGGADPHLAYAVLHGELTAGGTANVSVCWGPSDGGTNQAGAWANTNALGTLEFGPFSTRTSPGWADALAGGDLGLPGLPGSTTRSNDAWIITASGADLWGTADSGHFAQRQMTGDFDLYCRVSDFAGGTHGWRKAGIMARNTLDAGSRNAFIGRAPATGQNRITFQQRPTDGVASTSTHANGFTQPYYWLRLARSGNTFSGYWAEDVGGVPGAWSQMGADATITMNSTVYVGLAVTSHNNAQLTSVTFDSDSSLYSSNNLLYGQQYYYRCYAENDLGGDWADSSEGFLSLPPPGIGITNGPATDVAATSAVLTATLDATGSVFDVSAYWGVTDGGTNAGAWTYSRDAGSFTNGMDIAVSCLTTGLMSNTHYYYTFLASNAATNIWATPSGLFQAEGIPVISNSLATGVGLTAATFNGELLQGGAGLVTVYWGLADGGTNAGSWAATSALGTIATGPFATTETVRAGGDYFYRCYVTNSFGHDWADTTIAFVTPPAAISIADLDITEGTGGRTDAALDVTASSPMASNVWFSFATSNGTAVAGSDYTATNGTMMLAAGAPSTQIVVSVVADGLDEWPFEDFFVRISDPTNTTIARGLARCTIVDDDLYLKAWKRKLKITFSGYTRSTVLTNFPALVVLNESLDGFSYSQFASGSGGDLRFFNDSASAILNHEVEQWDPAGDSLFWVQVPEISGPASHIWAYWGNPARTNPPAFTTNGDVWAEGFDAVYHMGESNALDSTANMHHGTAVGNTNAVGFIGLAQGFDGVSDDHIDVVGYVGVLGTTSRTISVWIRTSNAQSAIVGWGLNAAGNRWDLRVQDDNGTVGAARVDVNGGRIVGNTAVTDNAWRHVAVTLADDGSPDIQEANMFVNGAIDTPYNTDPQAINTQVGQNVRIGKYSNNFNEDFLGQIDELRISTVARSADWIWAESMNRVSGSSFTTYGAGESVAGGTLLILR